MSAKAAAADGGNENKSSVAAAAMAKISHRKQLENGENMAKASELKYSVGEESCRIERQSALAIRKKIGGEKNGEN
jgi:hypothetical protein